jgi:hypothetical protein
MTRMTWLLAPLWILPAAALAQQSQPPPAPAQPQQGATAWQQLPRMQLERQFAGPLQDTVVQRWRDPVDGTICYIYLPITAHHSPPGPSGFAEYGANVIGSISCAAPSPPARAQTKSAVHRPPPPAEQKPPH